MNIENDVQMRTDAVQNTNLLAENTEIEIFITSIQKMSDETTLGDAQKCRPFKN